MSSQTFCLMSKDEKVEEILLAMQFLANSWAANASSLLMIICFSLSLMAGKQVFSNEIGMARGDSPNINSNGVFS